MYRRRYFATLADTVKQLWEAKTGYVSKFGDGFRYPSPGNGASHAVVPRAPAEFKFDIKYFNRDTRRAPVYKKVVTPENPTDNSEPFLSQHATNLMHKNARLSPEQRNLSLAGHLPISLWVYESDDIVAKYQKLDVPPPFGKFTDFKSNPNAHIKPFFKGYSS